MPSLTDDLFDCRHTLAGNHLRTLAFPWEVLPALGSLLKNLVACLPPDFHEISPGVWVGAGTVIAPTALVQGPTIIGRNCYIRHAAFIREYVLIGDDVVIGNSTEVKNAILFDGVQAPHFNYVGDSILGYKAHLGAGAILSNFKAGGGEVHLTLPSGGRIPSGLNKLGALLGDFADLGCNSVTFPGTIIGRGSIVYPLCPVRGYIPAAHILKNDGKLYAMV